MKIRNGFVSNSSSGSFIMHWRMRTFGEETNVKKAIAKMYGIGLKENTEEFDWEKDWDKERKPIIEEIIEKTVTNADGTFTSTFWTSMVNSNDDFGDAAKSLVINVMANDDFQVIDTKVEKDY